jgi:hypothetical protein
MPPSAAGPERSGVSDLRLHSPRSSQWDVGTSQVRKLLADGARVVVAARHHGYPNRPLAYPVRPCRGLKLSDGLNDRRHDTGGSRHDYAKQQPALSKPALRGLSLSPRLVTDEI